jgi:CAAX protease family protein
MADLLYLGLIAAVMLVDHFVAWPAFVRRSQADPGGARLRLWSCWMILLWALVAVGVGLWLSEARGWESLGFVTLHGWRLWAAIAVVSAFAISQSRQIARITRAKRHKRVKLSNPDVGRLAPHTVSELGVWIALSLSAGFCEEFIFRGYIIWALRPALGLWGAAAVSLVAFAVAHAYQGARGVLLVGIVGGVLTLVVLILGSLWPAIALHALVDVGQGLVAFLVMRPPPESAGV